MRASLTLFCATILISAASAGEVEDFCGAMEMELRSCIHVSIFSYKTCAREAAQRAVNAHLPTFNVINKIAVLITDKRKFVSTNQMCIAAFNFNAEVVRGTLNGNWQNWMANGTFEAQAKYRRHRKKKELINELYRSITRGEEGDEDKLDEYIGD